MYRRIILTIAALAVIAGCSSPNKPIAREDVPDEIVESTEVRPLQGPMTEQHAQRLSNLTVMAIQRVAEAREGLEGKNYQNAQSDLKKASQIMYVVKAEMPAAVVIDNIMDVKNGIGMTSGAVVQKNLVPVYAELDGMATYMPVRAKKAKRHLSRAERSLKKGKKKKAKKALEMAAAELTYQEVDVKIDELSSMISKARKLVTKRDYAAAKRVIDEAQPLVAISDDTFVDATKE